MRSKGSEGHTEFNNNIDGISTGVLLCLTSIVVLAGCPSLSNLSPVAWTSFTFFSLSSSSLIRPCRPKTNKQTNGQDPGRRHDHERRAAKLLYRVVVFLGGHVAVPFAPVVVDLLLLLVVEPHQLLGGCVDKGVKLVQVLQPDLGGVLVRGRDRDVFAEDGFSNDKLLLLCLVLQLTSSLLYCSSSFPR